MVNLNLGVKEIDSQRPPQSQTAEIRAKSEEMTQSNYTIAFSSNSGSFQIPGAPSIGPEQEADVTPDPTEGDNINKP